MEANKTPQLPIESGPAQGTVRALDDRLEIERLVVQDERAAELVRERKSAGHDPAQVVADAIEIGARVLDREDAAAEVDYVRAEFEKQAGALRERLGKTMEEGDRQLAERIAASFDGAREGSVQRQVAELLGKALAEQRTSLVQLFSAEEGANPLSDFKGAVVRALKQSDERLVAEEQRSRSQLEQLTRELVELKERQLGDERVAEAEDAGTRKGRSFEELVHAELEALAGAQDDAAHHVGDTSTESGAKKGDTVVELGAGTGVTLATVVFEAKNRKLSKNDAWAELNSAIAERDADYGVLVVAGEDKIPSGFEDLTEYQGNKMIAVLDREQPDPQALRLVYRYVRAQVLATASTGLEVDAAGVRAAADEAKDRLKAVNRIRKSLTGITTNADRARSDVDSMVADVERCLERVESLIEVAEADS
jgi:uncharacterized protein DUF2130